ncbi:MAG: N-acetylmuramoyl-L-alanine amidase [Prevotella sp.]|nr:N-acetylmuramoyl-L-alanine amidase [Prevotella sp.]
MKRLFALIIVLILCGGVALSQKKEANRTHTVVIDPGHGGAKPGAQGSRSQEKNITLAVAKKFGKLIEDNYPAVKVIYTRTTDADISLAERANIANRNKADLFISIHANSHPTATPSGVETFVMGLSESKANLEVAKKENADILLEKDYKSNAAYNDFDPNAPESYVMLTMFQNAHIEKSLNLAQAIQSQYKNNLKTINRGVKQAELFVLYKTAMPSVLTEIGFISNPTEEAFMLSDEGQAKIAICLFNAFMTYMATEEGITKPTKPVFNIAGYQAPGSAKTDTIEKVPAPIAQEAPTAPTAKSDANVKADSTLAIAIEAPEVKPAPETPAKAQPEPKPAPAAEAAPSNAKPTPTIELPKQEPQPEPQKVATEPKPEPQKAVEEPQPEPQKAAPQPQPEPQPVETPSPTPAPAAVREALHAPTNTAAANAKQYYTVQFLTVNVEYKAGAPELEGISDFQTFRQGRNIAYITGRFATRAEAISYCEHLRRATTFSDAWAYLYKVPSEPQAAPAPSKSAPSQSAVSGITYRIQFCSSTKEMQTGDPDLHGIRSFRYTKSGRLYVYTTGDFSTAAEAQRRCAEIQRTTPFKDAFVFAIHNGERITVEQAAALTK